MAVTMQWDWPAIRSGAAVALVFSVPLAVGARIAADAGHDGVAVGLSIGATIGFLLGAGCAAWVQRAGTPLSHGLVTVGSIDSAESPIWAANGPHLATLAAQIAEWTAAHRPGPR